MLHVAPHMSVPSFLKGSPISDAAGFVDVDKFTLQSKKFDNVFGLGDSANTPSSKTTAAFTSRAPVLLHNLRRKIEKKKLNGAYTGYASCPLIISRGHTTLAEFGYGGLLMEIFSRETGEEKAEAGISRVNHKNGCSRSYWQLWTRGMWYGTNGPIKPDVVKKAKHVLETSSRK